jgi:integrase
MREKLTDRFAATAPAGLYWDTDPRSPKGLLLRVTAAGARAWCLNYRRKSDDREKRLTLGDVASWPVAEIRRRAAQLRREIDAGGDPLGVLDERRAAPTVADLVCRFEAEALSSRALSTRAEYKALARDWILPALGKLKVAAVERDDIEKLHRKITAEGKPRRANAVKSLCSTLFNQAIIWKMRDDNPCHLVRGNPEHGRQRFLKGDELDRLIGVLERHRTHYPDDVDATMLAALTGSRRGEILSMRWRDLDLPGAIWLKPPETTKQRREHRLTLSPEAIEVLQRRLAEREAPGKVVRLRPDDFVFAGGGAKTHTNRLERHWREFRAEAGLTDVRFHDLRHSVASFLIEAGMSLPVIGSVLGHSKPQTTARYAHVADSAQQKAVDVVGKLVGRGVKR